MESLPLPLTTILPTFQPLMRAEVFSSFSYLLTGVLIGEAKAGTARASVFAPADYWPQRLSDLFCRHKLSGQALMAHRAGVALTYRYPHGLPERLCWIAEGPTLRSPTLTTSPRWTGFIASSPSPDAQKTSRVIATSLPPSSIGTERGMSARGPVCWWGPCSMSKAARFRPWSACGLSSCACPPPCATSG